MAVPATAAAAALLLLLVTVTSASFPKEHRKTHLQFYIHDKFSSPNATVAHVAADPSAARPSAATGLRFGSVYVIDDLVTEGPDPISEPVGRARGFYIVTSLDGREVFFNMQLVFTEGARKGSSITITGRDPILEEVRELEVTGGSGIFRLARGFVLLKTQSFEVTTGDAVLRANAYILHH